MSRRNEPPRLAVALVGQAVRRWPAELREQMNREWLGELHAIIDDPDTTRYTRTLRAVRFGASLAVRRPPSATATHSLAAAGVPAGDRPAGGLFGPALAVVVLGTAAALLLALVPGFVLAVAGYRDAAPAGLAALAVGPVLVALGAIMGRRTARRRPLASTRDVVRATVAVVAAVLCAQLFTVFGGFPAAPAIGMWATGLTAVAFAVARLARRPRGPLPWLAVALGCLLIVDLTVTAAVALGVGPAEAPRAYALAWFPTTMLDDSVLLLPLGRDPLADESARFFILDFAELLPHALLIATAFTVCYVHGAVRGHRRA